MFKKFYKALKAKSRKLSKIEPKETVIGVGAFLMSVTNK